MSRHIIFRLLIGAAALATLACDNSAAPGLVSGPVTVVTGLDPAFTILPSGGTDRIYTVRPKDATTRLLDARKADGTIVWSATIPACEAGYPCFPVVDNLGNIYIPTSQGLTSLKSDGTLRWTNAAATFRWVAAGTNGRVYAVDHGLQPTVYALDGTTGTSLWKTLLVGASILPIVVDETRSTVYAGGRGGPIALDIQTGSVKWSVSRSCFGESQEALASDGTIYVTCDSDFTSIMYAYDPTGTEKWHTSLGTAAGTFTPLVDDGGNIYGSNPTSVTSLSPSGAVNWRLTGLTQNFVHPAIDANKNVYIIAKLTSSAAWNLLVVKDGVVTSNKGAIDPTFAGALLLAPDGKLYYNSRGTLTSFDTGVGASPTAPWAQFGRDYARTSRR